MIQCGPPPPSLCWCTGAVTRSVLARSDHLLMHSLTVTPLYLFVHLIAHWLLMYIWINCSLFTDTLTHSASLSHSAALITHSYSFIDSSLIHSRAVRYSSTAIIKIQRYYIYSCQYYYRTIRNTDYTYGKIKIWSIVCWRSGLLSLLNKFPSAPVGLFCLVLTAKQYIYV